MNKNTFRRDDLYLFEEILLLALKDKKGTEEFGTMYHHAIGGAILTELMMGRNIELKEVKKKKLVTVVNPTPPGDDLLDECLHKMANSKKEQEASSWVYKFAGIKNLKHRVAQKLCDRGILKADKDKILLIFKRKIYPEFDPRPEKKIRKRLEEAIFSDSLEVDPRTGVLISLAHHAEILKVIFDKAALKKQKSRLEKIINGDLLGKATQEAIAATRAAILVATMVPLMAVTTVSH
jgi:hypothetical protein